jgi:hypothetical protein
VGLDVWRIKMQIKKEQEKKKEEISPEEISLKIFKKMGMPLCRIIS